MKKSILIALACAALLVGSRASATIVSTVPAYGASVFIAAPPSGSVTILKALQVSNDTANNSCAYLYAGAAGIDSTKSNLKLTVCALAGTTAYWPSGDSAVPTNSGIASAANAFFGELFTFSGLVSINTAYTVSGTVDSTKVVGQVTASYQYQQLR